MKKRGYNGYLVKNRKNIFNLFPPKYQKVLGTHITHEYNVEESLPPEAYKAEIIGYADSKDGIETLVVKINNKLKKPNNGTYHITLSLDPSKYKPKDSNNLLLSGFETLTHPISIEIEPRFFPFNNK